MAYATASTKHPTYQLRLQLHAMLYNAEIVILLRGLPPGDEMHGDVVHDECRSPSDAYFMATSNASLRAVPSSVALMLNEVHKLRGRRS